jgi:acyl-CoA thioesterase II
MAATVADLLSLRKISHDEYETKNNPERMGNSAVIAYGGNSVGVAANAAHQTVEKTFHCYSLLGNFLGPALPDRKLLCSIRRLRDTRTFATRLVEVSQILDDGSRRLCLFAVADFQIQEPTDFMTFSAPPSRKWIGFEDTPDIKDTRQAILDKGLVTKELAALHAEVFGLGNRHFECRYERDGVMTQTLNGMAKTLPTSQDHLSLTDKISVDWIRARHKLNSEAEHVSALAFILDAYLAFTPLAHNHQYLDDCGPCSSLDFALRIFSNSLDANEFHLREIKSVVGREGRTYSESRLWNKEGRMVCSMTQQSIMRPKPETKPRI